EMAQPRAAPKVGIARGLIVAIGDQVGGGAGGEMAVAGGAGREDDLNPLAPIGAHPADERLLRSQRAVVEDAAAIGLPHLMADPVRPAAAFSLLAQADMPAAIPQPQPADAAVAGPLVVVEDHLRVHRRE